MVDRCWMFLMFFLSNHSLYGIPFFRLPVSFQYKMPDGASNMFKQQKSNIPHIYIMNWNLSLFYNAFFIRHFASMNAWRFVITNNTQLKINTTKGTMEM